MEVWLEPHQDYRRAPMTIPSDAIHQRHDERNDRRHDQRHNQWPAEGGGDGMQLTQGMLTALQHIVEHKRRTLADLQVGGMWCGGQYH